MIYLFTGTPGSGKSFHAVKSILSKLNKKHNRKFGWSRVIANFNVEIKPPRDKLFFEVDNFEITPEYLYNFANKYHTPGFESQTLVVLDECGIIFNARDWQSSINRMEWIKLFSQHRKYGYDFILVAQFDRMIDRQIRSMIEYEVAHLKLNNIFWFLPIPVSAFLAITRFYGQKMLLHKDILVYSKRIGKKYNTFKKFDSESSSEIKHQEALKKDKDLDKKCKPEREGLGVPSATGCIKTKFLNLFKG